MENLLRLYQKVKFVFYKTNGQISDTEI